MTMIPARGPQTEFYGELMDYILVPALVASEYQGRRPALPEFREKGTWAQVPRLRYLGWRPALPEFREKGTWA